MTTPTDDELLALCEKASPGPWHACQDGKCSCKAVWTDDYPVAKVESGEWGDFYPALRVKENEHGLHWTSVALEAFMDGIPYGEIHEETARANVQFIAASREAIPRLIAERDEARVQFAEERRRHQEGLDGMVRSWNSSRAELALAMSEISRLSTGWDKTQRQLAKARAIAGELARFIRELPTFWPRGEPPFGESHSSLDCAYRAIRPDVRKWLEGK